MRILLIEDNARLRELTSQTLHEAGWLVDAFERGEDGFEALLQVPYDIVILDLGLPDIDGLEVLRRIRKRRMQVPTLVLTARGGRRRAYRRAGCRCRRLSHQTLQQWRTDRPHPRPVAPLPQAIMPELVVANVVLPLSGEPARCGDQVFELAPRERGLLEMLMRNADQVVSKRNLARERAELSSDPAGELEELTGIYVERGLDHSLARQVAEQLTARDALAAHARDELGISETVQTRPVQAALVSALTFAAGAVVPILVALATPVHLTSIVVAGATLVGLALLGGLGASAGGAGIVRGAARVVIWGSIAMAATAAIGALFGVSA